MAEGAERVQIDRLIEAWGLPALFLGGMVEGDGAAILGGALAHRGHLQFMPAWLVISAGALLHDQAWFAAGRMFHQHPRIARKASGPAAQRVLALVRRQTLLAALAARFLPGMRQVAPVALGATGFPWSVFALANLAAVLVWSLVFTGVGYGAGATLRAVMGQLTIGQDLALFAAAAGVVVAALVFLRRRGQRPDIP
jgi:membrane protein DedA with SNARE-associated domain